MELIVQQFLEGLAAGAIYASLALAITLIHRSTGIVNFAQGEMAMICTYVAWQLTQWGVPTLPAFLVTLAFALAAGMAIERVVVRPVENASLLTTVIVTFGLFLIFNNGAGLVWTYFTRTFPSPFPVETMSIGGVRWTWQALGTIVVLIIEVTLLWLLFQKTKIGLAMRAAASNPESSQLVGIDVGRIYMYGWGIASVLGAVAGILVAPRIFLEPNMMTTVIIYAFAAVALGGVNSPIGAVVAAMIVGVAESLSGILLPWIGSDLEIIVPFVVITIALLVKPEGLFGTTEVKRV